MKRFILSSAFMLLMVFSLPQRAHAQEFCALGSYSAGTEINCYVTSVSASAQVNAEDLPEGLSLYEELSGDQKHLSVRGMVGTAGSLSFSIAVSEAPELIICTADISPAAPSITDSGDINCALGDVVSFSVSASTGDSGLLSYQWYSAETYPGKAIEGATSAVYTPDTSVMGTRSYYCQVTNNNNGIKHAQVSRTLYINVTEPSVESISVNTIPEKRSYMLGDSLDTQGLSILVKYANGSSVVLDHGFEASPATFTQPGSQEVRLRYGNFYCGYLVDVKVNEADIEGIGVLTLPDKTEYLPGDTLDTTGLVIRAYTAHGHFDISEDLDCSPAKLKKSGRQSITVYFAGRSCSFDVNVLDDNTIESIDIASLPTRREYQVGDSVDMSGLSLRIKYKGRTELANSGFDWSPKELVQSGTQEITISYGEHKTSFSINVKDASAKPSTSPTAKPASTAAPESAAPSLSPVPVDRDHQARDVNALVKIIFAAAIISLAGLALYILYMQKRGKR